MADQKTNCVKVTYVMSASGACSIIASASLPYTRSARGNLFRAATGIGLAALIFSGAANARDGALDRNFGTQGITSIDFGASATPFGLAISPDGKVILGGTVDGGTATGIDFAVARLTRNGLADTSFSFDGRTTVAVGGGNANDSTFNTIVQSDGKIVVVGEGPDTATPGDDSDFKLVRLNTDGTLDTTFSADGKAYVNFDLGDGNEDRALDGAQLSNGKLVIVGSAKVTGEGTDFAVTRLNADGSRDTSFHGDGRYTFRFDLDPTFKTEISSSVAIDAAGNILVGGVAERGSSGSYDFAIARLTPSGVLDPNFSGDGRVTVGFEIGGNHDDELLELIVAPDGSIFATGVATDSGYDFAAVKFLPDGTPDSSYGTNGRVTIPFDLADTNNDISYGAALQADGKLVVTGLVTTSTTASAIGLARLDANGQLDPSFGFAGKNLVDLGMSAVAVRSRIQDGYLVFGGVVYPSPTQGNFLAGRVVIDTVFDSGFE